MPRTIDKEQLATATIKTTLQLTPGDRFQDRSRKVWTVTEIRHDPFASGSRWIAVRVSDGAIDTEIACTSTEKFTMAMPDNVNLRDVPKHFDGGDVDDYGRWVGAEMGCLECRTTNAMMMGITLTYGLAALECGECREVFAEYWV